MLQDLVHLVIHTLRFDDRENAVLVWPALNAGNSYSWDKTSVSSVTAVLYGGLWMRGGVNLKLVFKAIFFNMHRLWNFTIPSCFHWERNNAGRAVWGFGIRESLCLWNSSVCTTNVSKCANLILNHKVLTNPKNKSGTVSIN